MSVNYVRRGPRPLVHCYRIGPVRTGRVTKSSRATASESSPTQCLQYPKQQSSIIRGEEHCVPEAGMQWHILSGTSRSQGNILNGVASHWLIVFGQPMRFDLHERMQRHIVHEDYDTVTRPPTSLLPVPRRLRRGSGFRTVTIRWDDPVRRARVDRRRSTVAQNKDLRYATKKAGRSH